MSVRYVRNPPGREENVAAAVASAAVALGVGIVTFYVTRLFLSREPIGERVDAEPASGRRRSGAPSVEVSDPGRVARAIGRPDEG